MHLDVFALDFLEAFSLILLILPVFVELREGVPNIIDEELWQLLVVLDDIAEEFTETVVDDWGELLLEGERFKILPFLIASFESEDSALKLVYLLWLFGNVFLVLFLQTAHDHDVVIVDAIGEEIRNLAWHSHFEDSPDVQLQVKAFNSVQKVLFIQSTEQVEVLRPAFAGGSIDPCLVDGFCHDPLSCLEGELLDRVH